jgi:hypothetical protein
MIAKGKDDDLKSSWLVLDNNLIGKAGINQPEMGFGSFQWWKIIA